MGRRKSNGSGANLPAWASHNGVPAEKRADEARQDKKDEIQEFKLKAGRMSRHAISNITKIKRTRKYTLDDFMDEVEEIKCLALWNWPPDLRVALNAVRMKGQVGGLFIERSEKGEPGEFAKHKTRAQFLEALRPRLGDEGVKMFQEMMGKILESRGINLRQIELSAPEDTAEDLP